MRLRGSGRELFTRARFLDQAKPQTGRLNKSLHTVHAIANRHTHPDSQISEHFRAAWPAFFAAVLSPGTPPLKQVSLIAFRALVQASRRPPRSISSSQDKLRLQAFASWQ